MSRFAHSEEWIRLGSWTEDETCTRWQGELSDGAIVVWESQARFCDDSGLYVGRTPSLIVGNVQQSFEEAVEFAGILGQRSKWMRPDEKRSLVAEQHASM